MPVPSIICRGKNLHLSVMKQFLNAIPKQDMPKAAFFEYAEKRMSGFTQTHSQIARQMGLYYCDTDGVCHPRFTATLPLEMVLKYSRYWAERYFVPNPYTPSFSQECTPKNIYAYVLANIAAHDGDIEQTFKSIFNCALNETDKAKAYLLQFTDILDLEDGKVSCPQYRDQPIDVNIDRNDVLAYFHYYDGWTDAVASHKNRTCIHQRISYGAPGTGKSRDVEEIVKAYPDNVVRTTFHPDCDYSTFVGAYKPTMDDVAWRFVDKGKEAAVEGADGKPATEKKIVYKFVAQAFTKAYVNAWKLISQLGPDALGKPGGKEYLVIEEINRGNCAQIFGDIFQLLDRKNGISEYPICPDKDLESHLAAELKDCSVANAGMCGVDIKLAEQVFAGKKLVLPPNFYIWATMNTSDQSLFPMDSAFKRRWDWQYVPIKDGGKNWKIKFGDCEVDWWKFLLAVNKIVKSVTNSADKQLGYFFVKAKDAVIDAEMFVNKVAFYLWNDVFKDCELDGEAFKIERDGQADVLAFQDFFTEDGAIDEAVLKNFLTKLVPPPEAAQGGGATAAAGAAG